MKREVESRRVDGGCRHPARPSVFVTLNALIQPAALAFIPQLITARASAHTSGSWQLGYSVPPSLLPSFLPSPLIFHAAELPLSSKSFLLFPPLPHLVVSISPSQVVSFIILQYVPLHVHLSSLFLHFLCRPLISHLSSSFLPSSLLPGPAGVTAAAQRGSVLPAADAAAADQQRPAAEPGSCATGKGVWMSFIIS